MKRIALAVTFSLLASFAPSARAALVDVTGGTTTLLFTVNLDDLDVEVDNTGNAAELAADTFVLRISGGAYQVTPPAGSVHHDGGGLELDVQGVTVEINNWEFDFDTLTVDADLEAGPADLSTGVFNIVPCAGGGCQGGFTTGYGLFLRAQAADFFENVVFGDVVFDDSDQILHAELNPTFDNVPEPLTLTLLGVSVALAAVAKRGNARNA
jgi:hypothetical protein